MSKSVNSVHLLGNIGQNPQSRASADGTQRTMVSLATNERRKSGDKWIDHTEWHSIVFFGRLAEIAAQYVRKGSKVYVAGRLRTVSWEDDSNIKRSRTNIVAEELVLLDQKDSSRPMEPPIDSYQGDF